MTSRNYARKLERPSGIGLRISVEQRLPVAYALYGFISLLDRRRKQISPVPRSNKCIVHSKTQFLIKFVWQYSVDAFSLYSRKR